MKLMTEYVDSNLEVLTETKKDGTKSYAIEGVFMVADQKNKNGRVYPKAMMEKAVDTYVREQVNTGRAVGELNHPDGPAINLDKVSHKIVSLEFQGSNVVGKASILDTPMGNIVSGLLKGGVKLGVSSRGMGTLEKKNNTMIVGSDYMLATVDIVQDPSAPGAFVNGIMENVDWLWKDGVLTSQDIELNETEINENASVEEIVAFKNFLSKIVIS